MRAVTKRKSDGSARLMLGAVIWKETLSRKRDRGQDWEFSIELLRLREIEAVIRHRHNRWIPDPYGSDDVETCHQYLRAVAMTPGVQDLASWAKVWAPWADQMTISTISSYGADRKRMIKADAVAKMLFVTMTERTALGLRTIGACDVSSADRAKMVRVSKRNRDKARQESKRKAEGKQDRVSYEATSLSRLKPWVSEGISRRTWERRRDASPSRVDINTKGDTPASKAEIPLSYPRFQNGRDRVASLVVGLGDHLPAELQEAEPHGNGDIRRGSAAHG